MARVLIEGSSTAYGLWGGVGGGWADRLKVDLLTNPDRNQYATVINLATPLREVGVIEETLPQNARTYAGRSLARIGIFMLGTNESRKIHGRHSVPPEDFRRSVGRISAISHTFGYTPIFLGMPPIDEARTLHLNSRYTEEARVLYQGIVQEVAAQNNDIYIDIESGLAQRFPNQDTILDKDGMHVNDIGHAAIYEMVTPIVTNTLTQFRS
ncbi:MAG: SGNH/GDSL hydrolase family protein [Candidatus Saccharibacteria bacterium]